MDIRNEAFRLATVATIFVWVGWFTVIYAIIAGIFWWIDLVQRPAFNFLEALAISLGAIGLPFFLSVLVLGLGYTMRLFALYVASKTV